MKSNKILVFAAFCLFLVSGISFAQGSKVTALVKGTASGPSGPATDASVITYKGSEVINKTKLTPEGKFTIVLQPGNQYKLAFQGGKYYYHEEALSIPASDKFQEVPV